MDHVYRAITTRKYVNLVALEFRSSSSFKSNETTKMGKNKTGTRTKKYGDVGFMQKRTEEQRCGRPLPPGPAKGGPNGGCGAMPAKGGGATAVGRKK